ncbi:MAG TPA: acyl-CoA synthetase [Steroidobacteraceae bacterium]|nr:acyl-CoA synthetase [Steroidobacteraceae bacterium]
MHPKHHSRTQPSKPAYIMGTSGVSIDYATLEARSNRLAHFWRSIGLRAGDTIAVVLENHEWFLPLVWSADRSGLYYACLSHTLSGADLAYILNDSGAHSVVCSRQTLPLLQAAKNCGARPGLLLVDGEESDTRNITASLARFPDTPIADEAAGSDMLYSSGTTGRPKGIRKPFVEGRPIDEPTPMMAMAPRRFGMGVDTVYLSPAPLYHAGPLRWAMLVQRLGGTVVIMERFDPERALALIEQYRITASQWVPTHFSRMLQLPEDVRLKYDVSSMRTAIHAAAPCPQPVKHAMLRWWGPIIHEYYGGTENNGLTMISPDEWLSHPGSVGRAVVGKIRICGEAGDPVPARVEGTVYFEGGPGFVYHNDAAKTEDSRNKHGWTTLGDVGWIDEEGFLYLTDRKSFMIISGGVNIYPQEIENVLAVHPKVMDVAVIGAPDRDMGERVVAVVQPTRWEDAGPALASELQVYARERLGGVKTPRQIDFRRELPREPTGKLFKRMLRDQYRQSGTA